jgi:hydroxymethylbilane synthase
MTLADLPTGATVGTGSVRRRAQLAAARPDLRFGPLRGNIETRLRKRTELGYDVVVVAYAALARLGRAADATDVLDPTVCMPQVGQGALAVECRADDAATLDALAAIDDAAVHREVDAERAFLTELGGGCNLPCGARAQIDSTGSIRLDAMLASLDGHLVLRESYTGPDPIGLGQSIARALVRMYPGELAS